MCSTVILISTRVLSVHVLEQIANVITMYIPTFVAYKTERGKEVMIINNPTKYRKEYAYKQGKFF